MIHRLILKNNTILCSISVRNKSSIDYSKVPKIEERDLFEKFVRGSGPGGSNTNKNSNCSVLRHIPSGIVIKCHETRSLAENRKRARQILITKLDNLINGEDSVESQIKREEVKKSLTRKQKQEKLRELKSQWKEKENIT